MSQYGPNSSMQVQNKYRFHCPVMGRDEYVLACMLRRYHHWRGDAIKETECAMCMNASKCPVVHMIKKEAKALEPLYFDLKDERVHRLDVEIVALIEPIMVRHYHARGLPIAPEMFEKLTGHAQGVAVPAEVHAPAPEKARRGRPKKAVGTVIDVAKIGIDLADGINAGM